MMNVRVWPGEPYVLGATWDGEGVNFALFSEHADRVELCLFDHATDKVERYRIPLIERTNHVWHSYLPDLRPGQLYAYRVHGPYAPHVGHRFNPHKLVLDPYAKSICGPVRWTAASHGYEFNHPDHDLSFNPEDSSPFLPKCVVIDTAFTWGDDRPPRTPLNKTLIYECHVKGMTALHPEVPEHLRGTYLGLTSGPILEHLTKLGVTAVELLPVHQPAHDQRLVELGLCNYWGYNTVGFFAPDPRYASGCEGHQVTEFKTMVKAFHRAGIEVILDVVYNHTGEGNELGPTLCFRGIDNASYYRLAPHDKRRTVDYTGCGNSLNLLHPRVLQLVLDSLRYWVTEMHVDGFRFDLAATLARDPHEFDVNSRFFMTVQQDPVLSRVKLIAEPWDIGPGGYRLGGFPPGWAEWNGRYRDCVRRFWRADDGQIAELASRLSGSSDIFLQSGRGPLASINFVTCHDGFTLNDLVSYDKKHNLANGEDNRDGQDDNFSRNWGVEGDTSTPTIVRMRERMRKNFLATLALSQGVPMLTQGDEFGRSQHGNNNAYCQDRPLSWLDWSLASKNADFLEFARELFRVLRPRNELLRRRHYFRGRVVGPDSKEYRDVTWLRADGREMQEEDWMSPKSRTLGMLIRGDFPESTSGLAGPTHSQPDSALYLFLNASHRAKTFVIPTVGSRGVWREIINTAQVPRRLAKTKLLSCAPHALNLLSYEWTTG